MQWFRAFVRSWWYHDELSFCCPFRFGHLQFSIPCRPAGGDPRASSSTRGFPEECTAAFAPPALRPAFVGLAVTMVARLAPESTHRSPRYSDRLAPEPSLGTGRGSHDGVREDQTYRQKFA